MDHIAIMTKKWKLIPKILSGEKTIESRWYQTKRTPWNKVQVGETIYFKNSGEPVTAKAEVSEVMQFEIKDFSNIGKIIKQYGKEIAFVNNDPAKWSSLPKYCILIRLKNPQNMKQFQIDKKGFGNAAAWITIDNISKIECK